MAFYTKSPPFLVLVAILASGSLSSASEVTTWKSFLPNTPMPASLIDATANTSANNADDWTTSEEVVIMAYSIGVNKCKIDHGPHGGQAMESRFLLREELNVGAELTVHLKRAEGGISSKFPDLSASHALPDFRSENLGEILNFFHVAPKSKPDVIIQSTLARCEKNDPLDGQVRYCATTMDNLLWKVCLHLSCPHVKAVSATSSNKGSLPYLIQEITELTRDNSSIVCHQLGYPHAVYFCHQPPATTTYSVKLKGLLDAAGKEEVAFVVCHQRTEKWTPNYIAFRVLGVKPGTPVCHYLQYHDTVFYV